MHYNFQLKLLRFPLTDQKYLGFFSSLWREPRRHKLRARTQYVALTFAALRRIQRLDRG